MIELRRLKSKTGYLKAKNDNSVYDYEIYLGVLDKVENIKNYSIAFQGKKCKVIG